MTRRERRTSVTWQTKRGALSREVRQGHCTRRFRRMLNERYKDNDAFRTFQICDVYKIPNNTEKEKVRKIRTKTSRAGKKADIASTAPLFADLMVRWDFRSLKLGRRTQKGCFGVTRHLGKNHIKIFGWSGTAWLQHLRPGIAQYVWLEPIKYKKTQSGGRRGSSAGRRNKCGQDSCQAGTG